VRLAARGARETAGGIVAVENRDEAAALRGQAARVWWEALAIALVVTAVVMLARTVFGA
jgi:hypothetical protein